MQTKYLAIVDGGDTVNEFDEMNLAVKCAAEISAADGRTASVYIGRGYEKVRLLVVNPDDARALLADKDLQRTVWSRR